MPKPKYLVGANTKARGKLRHTPMETNSCCMAGDIISLHCFFDSLMAGNGYASDLQMVEWNDIQESDLFRCPVLIWSAQRLDNDSIFFACWFRLPSGAKSTPSVVLASLGSSLVSSFLFPSRSRTVRVAGVSEA